MARASPAIASFNAGELSPRIAGRTDTDKYQAGCKTLENYIPLIQGPVTRRGGTRFVAETKNSALRSWLVRFEFNTQDAYILEFGEGYIRFFTNHGQVLSGMSVYEIASPYSAADLTSADGTFALRIVQSADVLYICHPSFQTRKLTRFAPTNWVLSLLTTTGGPFKLQNVGGTTVYASASTGAITLNASAALFTAAMVGSLFSLQEGTITSQKPWVSATAVVAGDIRRHSGKNYVAATGGTTGSDAPVHTMGTVFDGPAVSWTYLDRGDGYAQITGFVSATQVNATVVSRIPELAVGSGNPTTRWAFGAWSATEGWPTHVAFFRERLVFGRRTEVWLSVAGDFENFDTKDDSGLVVADSAIKLTLTSAQVNAMLWMEVFSPTSEALMVGTAGSEFAIKSQTESQPFGPDNVSAQPVSTLGSSNVVPVRVSNTILFAQRSGRKLQDLTYDYYSGAQGSNDQTLYADHMLVAQINQMAYQQEPFSVLWVARKDGALVAMTYSREQYPNPPHGGWHRHPITNGFVESICTIPTPTSTELWMVVRRTINGVTKRYVEYMDQHFQIGQDQQDAFFVDCGGTAYVQPAAALALDARALVDDEVGVPFSASAAVFDSGDVGRYIYCRYVVTLLDSSGNPYTGYTTSKALITSVNTPQIVLATITKKFPATFIDALAWSLTIETISGLGYLEGQTVDVLVDGATHPQRVVTGGTIALQSAASKVHVGLPMPARLQTMRLNAGAQDGTSQGKKGRIPSVVVRVLETLGLRVGASFMALDEEPFRVPADLMDNAPPMLTGDTQQIVFPGDWNTQPWLCFEQKDPLPSTIVGIYPQALISDQG